MATPFPYPGNMTGMGDLLNYVAVLVDTNSTIGGFFGIGILISIAVISFITSKAFSTDKAFAFSGFLTLLSTIILRFMGLITDIIMYAVIIMFSGIVIWLWSSRQQETGA